MVFQKTYNVLKIIAATIGSLHQAAVYHSAFRLRTEKYSTACKIYCQDDNVEYL
jgi:hypothetical protein